MSAGFFSVKEVVQQCAAPTLKQLGFRKSGMRFSWRAPNGFEMVLVFAPEVFPDVGEAFSIQYGAVLPAHREWATSRVGGGPGRPLPIEGVITVQEFHPPYAPGTPWADVFVYSWRFDGRYGPDLAEYLPHLLRTRIVPRMLGWAEPSQLMVEAYLDEPGVFQLIGKPEWTGVFALVDSGPSDQLTAVLEGLPDDDPVRAWAEARLHARG